MLTVNAKTKLLPDSFSKQKNSINNKLLTLDNEITAEFQNNAIQVFNTLDIYKAKYATLDLYGTLVNQHRNGLSDEQYLIAILVKIARNSTATDYTSVLRNLSGILKCNYKDISIQNDSSPATIKINKIPFKSLLDANFTINQVLNLVKSLMTITVNISSANFEGSFEFDSIGQQKDENKGFGDLSQCIGGFLGSYIVDDTNSI